jgi:hypothetical protein
MAITAGTAHLVTGLVVALFFLTLIAISIWLVYCRFSEVPTIESVGRRYAARKTVDGQYDIFVLATNPMHPDYGFREDEIMRARKSRQLVVDTWEGVLRAEEDMARRREERTRL